MNYTPPDRFKQTSCKECVFAIYNDKTQVDCAADRISKFKDYVISAYDDEKEFFVIDRICNLHRPKEWNNGSADVSKAVDECSITFDVFIDCNDISIEYYSKVKNELQNLSYAKNKINVYLFQSSESKKDEKHLAFQLYQDLNNCIISLYFDRVEYIYSILQKSKN